MKFRCVWSIVLILGLAAAGTQAEAAGDRAVIAHSAYDLEEKGNQEFSTRSLFTEDGTGKQETTFFFNDGFGRLTEFHEYTEGARMFLIIRQNMNVVWQEAAASRITGSQSIEGNRMDVFIFRYAWVNMSIPLKSAVMTGGPLRKAVFPLLRIP